MKKPLDLRHTKRALDAFDARDFEKLYTQASTATEVLAVRQEEERLEAHVLEAFYLDTADRNDPSVVQNVKMGPWLRKLLQMYPPKP